MKKIIILAAMLCGMSACYYDKEQLLTPPKTAVNCQNYSFAKEVNPIIQLSCSNGSGCHGAGSSNGPGALTSYAQIVNAASLINASIMAGRMPLGSRLSNSQIQTISCWINNGTPNN